MQNDKSILRRQIISTRDAIPEDKRRHDSAVICDKLADVILHVGSRQSDTPCSSSSSPRLHHPSSTQLVIAVFCSFGSEVSLAAFIEQVGELPDTRRPMLVAPISLGNHHMEFVRVESRELLSREAMPDFLAHPARAARGGIPADRHVFSPACIDFMIAPGVAFDAARGRLGYGGGYYDAYLAREGFHAPVCAVCFDEQVLPDDRRVPRNPADRQVDMILTPTRLI